MVVPSRRRIAAGHRARATSRRAAGFSGRYAAVFAARNAPVASRPAQQDVGQLQCADAARGRAAPPHAAS